MDDQTFGVAGKVEARRTVRMLVESLTRQRLTLNSGKTRFLTPPEQAEHFWLDANEMLDSAQVYADAKVRYPARVCLEYIWGVCEGKEKKGHWDKVYKRILRVAALAHTDCVTLAACKTMIVEAPSLAERVFEYLLARNRYAEYLQLWQWLARTKNNIYEDVEMAWFEQVLLVSPPRAAREAFLSVASAVLRGRYRGSGKPGVMVPAALLVYWFWDGRQGRILETLLSRDGLPPDARRTVAAILCARKSGNWKQWLLLAGRHASREVAGLIGFVTRITSGEPLELVQPLVFVKRPVVYDRFIYDARAWLRLELLAMSPNKGIKVGIKQVLAKALKHPLTQVEEASAKRIAVKVK